MLKLLPECPGHHDEGFAAVVLPCFLVMVSFCIFLVAYSEAVVKTPTSC